MSMSLYDNFNLTINPESVYIFSKPLQYSAEIKPLYDILLYSDEMNMTSMTKDYILDYSVNDNDINQDRILTKIWQMNKNEIIYSLILVVNDNITLKFSPIEYFVTHHTYVDLDTDKTTEETNLKFVISVDISLTEEKFVEFLKLNEQETIDFYKDFYSEFNLC